MPVVCSVSLRVGQTTFFASVVASCAKPKNWRPGSVCQATAVTQPDTCEDDEDANDHRLFGEKVKTGEAGDKKQQCQRKLDFIGISSAILMVMAGAEGLEPPTFGFGDRRSAN